MSSTATNKQALFAQTVGSASSNTLFVQGGQAPSILVDMDASLSDDSNSGGVIDSITIVRNDYYRDADYVVSSGTSGTVVAISSGQIVLVFDTGVVTTPAASGFGYYTYTGATTLTGINTELEYSGGTTSGFLYQGVNYAYQPEVTFVFYHTRNTTTPIPGSGDYKILFAKQVPANTATVDCSDVMPQLAVPVVGAGNTSGLGEGSPLRNKGIYLERGDRIYVGVFPDGPNISGYTPGVHVIAQGGFF